MQINICAITGLFSKVIESQDAAKKGKLLLSGPAGTTGTITETAPAETARASPCRDDFCR
jgi:hypothetical protein